MTDERARALTAAVAAEFRRRLVDEYVPRIEACVARLSEDEVWARANASSNPVGVLLLHLEGNVRQWILAGLAGRPDVRDRDAEFAATRKDAPASAAELVARLRATVEEAAAVVDGLGPGDLLARRVHQGRFDETGLGAVLHVVEHFSGHTGQIALLTKQARDVDLGFYDL